MLNRTLPASSEKALYPKKSLNFVSGPKNHFRSRQNRFRHRGSLIRNTNRYSPNITNRASGLCSRTHHRSKRSEILVGLPLAQAWDRATATSAQEVGKEGVMDFAAILVVGNTLLAVFIYLVVTKIWQD